MIRLEKISKKYGDNYAIKDITTAFDGHNITAIIGSSGSGKSTLLKCINGLEQPTSGEVFIGKDKLRARNRQKLSARVGMVFQNFNLFPHMSVQQNLIYSPIQVLRMKEDVAIYKAGEFLSKFGLKEKLNVMPSSLSGGQKQRIAIARSLMMSPEAMLFDEPTSALDPEVVKDFVEIILDLKKEMTMIVVTHHINFARAIADRILFMDKGLLLSDQPTEEFFKDPSSHRARLFLENIGDLG